MRFIFALLLFAPGAAFAHAMLDSTIPRVGSTVLNAPTELTLVYSDPIRADQTTVVVVDASGAHMESGAPHLDPGDSSHVIVPVKKLSNGTYSVTWHAVSFDNHRTEGRYHFKVAAP